MGFGSTAKKIQRVTSVAEDIYAQTNQLVEELRGVRSDVDETTERVAAMESELEEQRALIQAMAEQQGIDVDAVVSEAEADAEPDATADATDATDGADEQPSADTAESDTAE